MTNLENFIIENHLDDDKELEIQDDAYTLELTISEIKQDDGPLFDDLCDYVYESKFFIELARAFAGRNEIDISKTVNEIRMLTEHQLKIEIASIASTVEIEE